MTRTLLLLVLVIFLSNVKYGSTDSSPSSDALKARNYILNIPGVPISERQAQQDDNPYSVFSLTKPWSFMAHTLSMTGAVLNAIAAQFDNDLEVIAARQNEVIKVIERACAKGSNCKKVPMTNGHFLRSSYLCDPEEEVTNDKIEDVVNTLRTAMEEVDLRQNSLYEYVNCACEVNSLRPVLNVLFANHPGDPTFRPDRANSLLSALITQIPYNFSNWFGYNFNPLNSIFGGLFGFPFNFISPSYNAPNYWNYKPQQYQGGVYNSASSYSGPSGNYASMYGYSSGAGSTFNSATATSGPQGTSVTTNGRPGENYVVHHPGGGSTHVSTSGDGSSFAVASTSGRVVDDPKNPPQVVPGSVLTDNKNV